GEHLQDLRRELPGPGPPGRHRRGGTEDRERGAGVSPGGPLAIPLPINTMAEGALAEESCMKVLVVDVGGTNIKILATGQEAPRKFPSGPDMTPEQMVAGVKQAAEGWDYDVVAIGYPGPVIRGRPVVEPFNLGPGWVGFNFEAAFGRPVKLLN